jgi:hypothetical protein
MTVEQTPGSAEDQRRKEDDDDRGFFFWWFGTPGGRTASAIILLALIGAAIVYFNPALRQKILGKGAKQVVKVETQRWGSSVVFPIEGNDAAGKRAAFDVAVLPPDLSWVRGSISELNQGSATIPENEAPQKIFTPELREGLGKSAALIAVGLASQEGQVEEETQRAARRAQAAAGWLSTAFQSTPIWALSLGQFKGTCPATTEGTDTGWQRPLIIVGIKSQEAGVNLSEAFDDAISGKTNLPSRDCYTNFDFSRFR